jgi:DNA (cytosine-5)-methyltransferase 1
MPAYYNEFEPFAAQWLKNLSDAGHIAKGRVDSRSILEVTGEDVGAATQAHFFAGIGVWSHALRLAGWPDDRPVWTGSCPCQPFSVAGRGDGVMDPRHLWPRWFELIDECRPPVVFGEQVASPDGLAWLDAVRTDMEAAGYAFGAADLCAAGVGAPHIRQRLYFVGVARSGLAHHHQQGRSQFGSVVSKNSNAQPWLDADGCGAARGLADADGAQHDRSQRDGDQTGLCRPSDRQRLGNPERAGRHAGHVDDGHQPGRLGADPHGPTPTSGFWSNPDWVACRDGKQRPVEPGTFPLAHGAPARVGKLRAFGNAIVSEVAATFIKAVMQSLDNVNR